MSHRCPICPSTFTRSFNLRRHVERVHDRYTRNPNENSFARDGGGKQASDARRSKESYYDGLSESDTNESASEPMKGDIGGDRDDTDNTDSDTEEVTSSEEEPDETETDIDVEEDESRGYRGCDPGTTETLAALTEINKAIGNILKNTLQRL